jgi:uncharacterized protein (TIGR02302 family)
MDDTKDTRPSRMKRDAEGTAEPRLMLRIARTALTWERLWSRLWPAAIVAGLFAAAALAGLPQALGGWLHALILAVFAVLFLAALGFGLRGLRLPDEEEAVRRLERDSGLTHRPLGALRDRLAGGDADPATAALWRAHRERLMARLAGLRVGPPHPNLAARDPLALRMLVGLLVIVAAAGTWGDWGDRFAAALTPRFGPGVPAEGVALDIWVAPPEYTRLPPVFLNQASIPAAAAPAGTPPETAESAADAPPQPLRVPVNSTVLARVTGGGQPVLVANDARTPFERIDGESYQAAQPVTGGSSIAVEQGSGSIGSWPIEVVPDRAPTIEPVEPPQPSERGALRIEYGAKDDYGIAKVSATLRLVGGDPGIDRTPIELPLPLPHLNATELRNASFHDLTPHPWAGLPVTLRLEATDGAGQTGSSPDIELVLPERQFRNPVARTIIAQRRELTLRPDTAREQTAAILDMLSRVPEHYYDDIVVFLGLRTAVARLQLDRTEEAVPAIQSLLWDLALRVEDGELSIAERTLRDAQQALMDALDRNADDQEIDRLMDELQAAMDQFLDAMEEQIRQALERGEQLPQIPPSMQSQMLDRQDLQQMLEQMREMAQTGARDAARQMLSQLQQMMENLRSGSMAQMQQQQNQAGQMLQELEELTRQQQELLDRTFREAQQGQGQQGQMGQGEMGQGQMGQSPNRQGRAGQGQQGQGQGQMGQGQMGQGQMGQGEGQTPGGSAAEQEALRRQLGELMRRLGEMGGEIPGPLGRAERAMRDAGQALGQGQPGSAVPPQTRAVDELQQGLQGMAEEMAQQMMMGQQGGMPGQGQQRRMGQGRDPLGRQIPSQSGGEGNLGNMEIPDKADLQRAREILDELRRRSGESERPEIERDYIYRLLRQF